MLTLYILELYFHFSFFVVLLCVFKPEQSSCRRTTWMRPKCWVTALPSWRWVGSAAVDHRSTSRKHLGMGTTSRSPRKRFVGEKIHLIMGSWVNFVWNRGRISPTLFLAKIHYSYVRFMFFKLEQASGHLEVLVNPDFWPHPKSHAFHRSGMRLQIYYISNWVLDGADATGLGSQWEPLC